MMFPIIVCGGAIFCSVLGCVLNHHDTIRVARLLEQSAHAGTLSKFDHETLLSYAVRLSIRIRSHRRGDVVRGIELHFGIVSKGDYTCAICYRDHIQLYGLAPCGHTFCGACVYLVDRCPNCREYVDDSIPLFIDQV
jgi:hypothetical protein